MNPKPKLFAMGSTGYLGRNLLSLSKTLGLEIKELDLRRIEPVSLEFPFGSTVIDLSMPNKGRIATLDEITTFLARYSRMLDSLDEKSGRIIRVSSVFDIVDYYRQDSYTAVSKSISEHLLSSRWPKLKVSVLYVHACFGGEKSNSFIDSIIHHAKFSLKIQATETLREYLEAFSLIEYLLEILFLFHVLHFLF
ncbi:hypothetical protein EBU71_23150 [bacterium]|nr:hypothetical protein [Candidatus Elulimicrobium humile]